MGPLKVSLTGFCWRLRERTLNLPVPHGRDGARQGWGVPVGVSGSLEAILGRCAA